MEHAQIRGPLEDMADVQNRFHLKCVENSETGCVEWQGKLSPAGYGRFTFHGITQRAHRVAYFLEYGFLTRNLHVCHHCDNPKCVKPEHLFLGTDADNIADKVKKGRSHRPVADTNPNTPFTWDMVRAIRDEYSNSKLSYRAIGRKIGVSHSTISGLLNNRTWIEEV